MFLTFERAEAASIFIKSYKFKIIKSFGKGVELRDIYEADSDFRWDITP